MAKFGKDWLLGRTPEQQERKQEARDKFEARKAATNAKFDERSAKARGLIDEGAELKRAHKAGEITDEEFAERKQDFLRRSRGKN